MVTWTVKIEQVDVDGRSIVVLRRDGMVRRTSGLVKDDVAEELLAKAEDWIEAQGMQHRYIVEFEAAGVLSAQTRARLLNSVFPPRSWAETKDVKEIRSSAPLMDGEYERDAWMRSGGERVREQVLVVVRGI